MKIATIAKYIDQPKVLHDLHKKMPAILIGGGGAFALHDTFHHTRHAEGKEKRNHWVRNGIVFAATAASLLLVSRAKINGERILGGEPLNEIVSRQTRAVEKYFKRVPEAAKNEDLAKILNTSKTDKLHYEQISKLEEMLPIEKTTEKLSITRIKNILKGKENPPNGKTLKEWYAEKAGEEVQKVILPGNKDLNSKEIFGEIGRLSLLGFTPVAGGVAGGILADKVTNTGSKKRTANKVKEGLYQFLANIFLCNVGAGLALGGYEALVKAKKVTPSPGKKLGVILSGIVATGIIGGSFIANWISKKFVNPLFDGKKSEQKGIYSERKPEALDVALHADDIATAGVLAGFKWIEPVLPLMYFVSGYRAGTGYRNNEKHHKIHQEVLKSLDVDKVQFREEIKRIKEEGTNFEGKMPNFHDYRIGHSAYKLTH